MRDTSRPLKLALLGAAPDTGNLGVSALCFSVIAAIARLHPSAALTIFDHGIGARQDRLISPDIEFAFGRCGLRNSRRLYMPEAIRHVQIAAALGIGYNAAARVFRDADAVLDITGGDSFTDLYGMRRFRAGLLEKRLAIRHSGGLILLPQTYGPYTSSETQRDARDVIARAALAIARDQESHDRLRDLLGHRFDAERHVLGVDVAFALPAVKPPDSDIDSATACAIETHGNAIGFNVSGLCLNNPEEAARRFGFRADYSQAVIGALRAILYDSDRQVVLVPHVLTPTGHPESDVDACRAVAASLREFGPRIVVAPAFSDPRHAKWLIGRCAWFCGTRMHATIAGLSSGVPTASIAYSLKTRGVFATCGCADAVADPRSSDTAEVIDTILTAWRSRDSLRDRLAESLPVVVARASSQMASVIQTAQRLASDDRRTVA